MNKHSYFWWKRLAKQLAQEEGKLLCPYQEINSKVNFIPPLKLLKHRTGRRLKYGLIAVIIALLSFITLSVTAFRDYSLQMLMKLDGKTGVINNVNDGIYLPSEMQVPVYVPNGFTLTSFIPLEQGGTAIFENILGDTIYLIQRSLEDTAKIDTEHSEVYENQKINGDKAILTIKHDGSSQALYWNTPDYSYELVSTISLEEMLKIAESIPQEGSVK